MERLKHIKEILIVSVESHMEHLESVDTHELGEVIDMIKDIEEAIYYCSIVEAMEAGKTYIEDKDKDIMKMVSTKIKGEA